MEIKLVGNNDFMQLLDLNTEMYKEIDTNINSFQATNTLMAYINTKSFLAVGLYDEDVLVGFVTGIEQTTETFYFTGIYLVIKNSEWTQRLIEFSFDHIQKLGYKAWEVDSTNSNIASIMQKYGAVEKYTRFRKEF